MSEAALTQEHSLEEAYADGYADGRAAALRAQEQPKNMGEVSDGYHTFNELYHHRAVLFSVICNDRSNLAWKSKRHSDGTMFDGMFIVGIETPNGQATYHYDIKPYWDIFNVPELDHAPEWDGHTPAQAIERMRTLAQEQNEPLTLEQAIIRIGDAVWIRLKIPGEYDGWRFLIGESGPYFVFTLASGRKEMYLKETIGSDYNLYAHEPKGADQ